MLAAHNTSTTSGTSASATTTAGAVSPSLPLPGPRGVPGPTSDAVAQLTQRLTAATHGRDQLVRQLQATNDPALRQRVRAASTVVDYLGAEREKQAMLIQLREALRTTGAAPSPLVARLAQMGLATTAQAIIREAASGGHVPAVLRQSAQAAAPRPVVQRPVVAPVQQTWSRDEQGRSVATGGPSGMLLRALRENRAPLVV